MYFEDEYGLISRDTVQRTADAIRFVYDIDDPIYPPQFPDYIIGLYELILGLKRYIESSGKLYGSGYLTGTSSVSATNVSIGPITISSSGLLYGSGYLTGESSVSAHLEDIE